MELMTLIATLVGQLALIAKDPALGYRGEAITNALALLATLVTKGEEARAEIQALADQIQSMVDENREPTKEEWQSLRDRSKAAHDILNPPPPPEEEEPTVEVEDPPASIDPKLEQ